MECFVLIYVDLYFKAQISAFPWIDITSLRLFAIGIIHQYFSVLSPPLAFNQRLPKIVSMMRTIDSFDDEDILTNFRFQNKDQLRRVLICFQMPEFLRNRVGNKFRSEELFLVVLYYLHYPQLSTNLSFRTIFGWPAWKVKMGAKLFFK